MRLYALLLFLVCSVDTFAQDYYVVIGTYESERNAKSFTGFARSIHYDAQYFKHPATGRFYVYVLKTANRQEASELAMSMRKESDFTDAWMFADASGEIRATQKEPDRQPQPVRKEPVEAVIAVVPIEVNELEPDARKTDIKPETEVVVPIAVQPDVPLIEPEAAKPKGKYFRFVARTSDGREVIGQVYNVDKLQRRDLATYKVNSQIDVVRPANPVLSLSCEIFGYNDVVKIVDYNNPAGTEGVYLDDNGVWTVPFELEPMKKGDVSMMNNVVFYKDAVIMLPQSKDELDELVEMMKSNPRYKIKIHGHYNGNEKNLRITTLGSTRNYFSMTGSSSKIGSGKDVSKLRAEAIEQYLADNGIDKNRIETYAWGGMEMLAPQGSAAAARVNNRIEIEILDD